MGFDPNFLAAVRDLRAPIQGTEQIAELIYMLIRFVRPRTVLEGGMGYTSPFIAKALSDNAEAWKQERRELVAKTDKYISELGALPDEVPAGPIKARGLTSIYRPKTTKLATKRTEWVFSDPALLRPGYYLEDYHPVAYLVDNLSLPTSSASKVLAKISELGLSDFVSAHEGEFWTYDFANIPQSAKPIDMIWVDLPMSVMNAMSVIEGAHWSLLNPNGGLLLIHCMLTNEGGQGIMREFERIQRQNPKQFELMGLIEPHKVVQNNVLIIRKTTGVNYEKTEELFVAPEETALEHAAFKLVGRGGQ